MGDGVKRKGRRIHCAYCGEFLYEDNSLWAGREPESCGERECNREVRDMIQQDREERALDAANDDYERYR